MRTLKQPRLNLHTVAHPVNDHAVVQAADDLASGFLAQEGQHSVDEAGQASADHGQAKAAGMHHMLAIRFAN